MIPNKRAVFLSLLMICSVGVVPITFTETGAAKTDVLELTVADAPQSVTQGSTFTITYNINNTDTAGASYTLEIPSLGANVSVNSFSGDIQSSDPNGNPPSASSSFADPNNTVSITVTYQVISNATGSVTINATAREPLSGGTEDVSSSLTITQAQTGPTLGVSQVPDTVEENESFTIDYELSTAATNSTAYTIEVPNLPSAVSVSSISGDVKSQSPDGTPPSATSTGINTSKNASISITYQLKGNLVDGKQTVTKTIEVTATDPISGDSDSVSADVTVENATPEPTDPTKRALKAAGKSDPAAITQNDITAAVTRFSRGQEANDIDLTQNDITVLITLFERNN